MKPFQFAFAVLAGLLAVLMLVRVRRAVGLVVIGTLLTGAVVPQPVYGQIGIPGLTAIIRTILNTINSVLQNLFGTANGTLTQITSIFQSFQSLMDNVVYPRALIARAQSLAAALIAQFRGRLANIFSIGVNSAQLPNPTSLESIVRNRNTSDLPQLARSFVQTYGDVPPPDSAHEMDRQLVDMDDAMAMAQLKTLKAADEISDRTIGAAEDIENEARQVAPGTASYLSAAATIAALQNQAVMQKMLAAQMRQEAARAAHDNMLRKRNAMAGREIREGMGEMLQRR
jgi:hypothetical protein